MGNGAATANLDISNLALSVNEAVGRLLLAASDRTSTPRMVFLSDLTDVGHLQAVILWPRGTPLLADVATSFEHFGLRVADRDALELPIEMPRTGALYKFTFLTPPVWSPGSLSRVSEAFAARASDGFEIDDYAKLIVAATLSWHEVVLIRAVSRFARQAGLGLSENYVIDTLLRHTEFVVALVRYFEARFDPDIDGREHTVAATEVEVQQRLDAATTLDEDRILRSVESFVTACVRTNWYQVNASGAAKNYASFKLDSSKLALAGPVVPYREIYVYADNVEGVHLRVGAVARGGLRYSDRPEDYRTEALGLMKTQNVKNSPIVPVGAKGAFVRKNPAITPAEAYTTFIRGLLDVTDNVVENTPVAPVRTVTYDTPDTYLVVAADKGTASFSDLANTIAVDAGYWLGDAFASGGTSGYDHKAIGITARGAWVSVRRHFDELGIDVANDPVTVAGVGDMSGDVFGNGMLLSESIKLVAAFDHRHIFIDPNPDSALSFAERRRLAALDGPTSWNDYDRDVLSPGAGIYSRTAKKVGLSPQAQDVLGIEHNLLSPNELIKAILRAPVDLLWNGGIGTYVRASGETHSDAADPVNDSVRVTANELRCAVIGEGGNLGLTQRARIEFALGGGKLNADFIDNAAGVATSDLEVNLKVALDVAVAAGRIDHHQRNKLLADSLDDVARVVLDSSESQTLAISLAESQASMLLNRHERLIDNLEHNNGINRTTEVLPTKKELVSRTQAGLGLTRPEIAVLLAQSKNVVQKDLLDSTVPEEPVLASSLRTYFPERIRSQLTAEISEHHLAREIIATKIADDLINHVGPGLIYQLDERLGVKTPDVARAYAVVRAVFDVDRLWKHAQRPADAAQRWKRLHAVQHFIEQTASWILRRRPAPLDVNGEIERYQGAVRKLMERRASAAATDTVAELRFLSEIFELIETASSQNVPIEAVAEIHSRTDALLGLSWLTSHLDSHVTTNWWDSMAASAVRDDLAQRHHVLVGAILELRVAEEPTFDPIDDWQSRSVGAINRFSRMTAELRRDGVVDVSRACTASAELGLLVRSTQALKVADRHR
ncbi:NAD-glutamate dehydrogenase [Rhodococcus fascians]|nr:NAD-glutamate dehydrogenase [Rhodococcus fascians]MBY4238372.1 NAD-glutamate dehydrogenase [Rhodococcus fascians]MBY4254247.1 NAD-glutamate dehydrogenase [Rhodococcus fascians]MBY4269628.1 NAD-glutamate dehydrogenase [Rhodococcus fascians]